MIAMALACNPDILIADESTTALDVTTQAEILDLIKRLQVSRGMAMLLITHDMGIVAEVADEVAVMLRGCIVRAGQRRRNLPPSPAPLHAAAPRLTVRLEQNPRALTRPAKSAPADTPCPVISVRDLSKFYGRRRRAVRWRELRRPRRRQCQPRPHAGREPRHRRRKWLRQDSPSVA